MQTQFWNISNPLKSFAEKLKKNLGKISKICLGRPSA
jgi:hypothetical protein